MLQVPVRGELAVYRVPGPLIYLPPSFKSAVQATCCRYLGVVSWLVPGHLIYLTPPFESAVLATCCRYLCVVSWLFTACLGPWSGWLAACNSLNTIKFEVRPDGSHFTCM